MDIHEAWQVVEDAVQFTLDEGYGENTPENAVERRRINEAWDLVSKSRPGQRVAPRRESRGVVEGITGVRPGA